MLKLLDKILQEDNDFPSFFAFHNKGKEVFEEIPSTKKEAFKYTPISNTLTENYFYQTPSCDHHHCDCEKNFLPFDAYEIHFCNGCLHHDLHCIEGVEQMSLADAFSEHETAPYLNKIDLEKFPLAALNTACVQEGLFLRISKTLSKPIALVYNGQLQGFHNSRNFIILEKGVKAEIFELYQGSDEAYFINTVNEIFIAPNAHLTHYFFQNDGKTAVHCSLNHVSIKENGKFNSFAFQSGSKLSRHETHVLLQNENASAVVNVAYNIKGQTLVDTTTDIEHLAPHTNSDQIIKGVIDDKAHGVFQGKIFITSGAIQTNGHQTHRALLLSSEAQVDAKPALEIYADDVKCSHGAASGDLDEEQLFYLKSRGIEENEAKKILTSAFLNEAFKDVSNKDIKDYFERLSFKS